jgi:RNA polymerase sigma-70 factor (ECF subfamily)
MRRIVGHQLKVVRSAPDGPPSSREQRFEDLYQAHGRPLLAYALRRVHRPEDAADVVAETMLVAWRRLADVPPGVEAKLWLFGVARWVLANQRRGSRRRDRLGDRLRQDLRAQVGPDHAPTVVTSLAVRTALAELSADDREVLQLTAWEGLDPQEIATMLGMPAATVRSRLHRARGRLRERLAAAGIEAAQRNLQAGHVDHDERALVRDTEEER